jgi:hypothetical protein
MKRFKFKIYLDLKYVQILKMFKPTKWKLEKKIQIFENAKKTCKILEKNQNN